MNDDIEKFSKFPTSCQIHQNIPLKAPMHPWKNSQTPWMKIHSDFTGPYLGKKLFWREIFRRSNYKQMSMCMPRYISQRIRRSFRLMEILHYLTWIYIMPMNSMNTISLTQCLKQSFSTSGLPVIIVTDNRLSFTSKKFKLFNEKKWNKTHFYRRLSCIFQ